MFQINQLFTESALRPLGRFSLLVAMSVFVSVCLCVCVSVFLSATLQNTLFLRSWRLLVESRPIFACYDTFFFFISMILFFVLFFSLVNKHLWPKKYMVWRRRKISKNTHCPKNKCWPNNLLAKKNYLGQQFLFDIFF